MIKHANKVRIAANRYCISHMCGISKLIQHSIKFDSLINAHHYESGKAPCALTSACSLEKFDS